MKSTENRIQSLEATMAAIARKLGIGDDEVETPKTSARLSRKDTGALMARTAKLEDIVIEAVGANRADGRMRLPKRMFAGRETLTVDGTKFHSLESDQGRSPNFSPETIGAEVGDTVTFVHEGGTKWTAEIESGSRRKKTVSKSSTAKPKVTLTKKAAAPKQVGRAVKVGTNKEALVNEAAKKFGQIARENAAEDFVNENIVEFTKYEDDPRQYLTSRENAQAKKIWKGKAGMTLSQWVEILSDEVYG